MIELLMVLLFLAGLLALVTVVGHANWLLVGMFVRAFRRSYGAETPPPQGAAPMRDKRQDAEAMLRFLAYLAYRGRIDPGLRDRLAALAEIELGQGQTPVAAPAPAAAPETAQTPAVTRPSTPHREPPPTVAEPASLEDVSPGAGLPGVGLPGVGERVVGERVVEERVVVERVVEEPSGADLAEPGVREPVVQRAAREAAPPVHPLDRDYADTAPSGPRRTWAGIMQAFMEQKNIRWGEIISGLLIVISAVGLVISLWATLRDSVPYLPALLFMLGTAAFHAAGHYTLHRWKLASISRAVLIIGTLLIPLNVLAAIALEGAERPMDWLYFVAAGVGLSAYGAMAYFAGGSLLGRGRWYFVIAVIGSCVGQMIINRAVGDTLGSDTLGSDTLGSGSPSWLFVAALGSVPLGSYLVSVLGFGLRVAPLAGGRRRGTSGAARRGGRSRALLAGAKAGRFRGWAGGGSQRRSYRLLLITGVATFSLAVAVALMLGKSGSRIEMLGQLAPLLSLAGATWIVVGLGIHRGHVHRRHAGLRTLGTSLALIGGSALVAMVAFAWPKPHLLIATGGLNFVLLGSLALLADLALLHLGALACFGLASFVGYHQFTGGYAEELQGTLAARHLRALLTGATTTLWALIAAGVAAAGCGFLAARRYREGLVYLLGALGYLIVAAALALIVGFGHSPGQQYPGHWWASGLLLVVALVLGVLGWRLPNRWSTWGAVALGWAAALQLTHVPAVQTRLQGVAALPDSWLAAGSLLCAWLAAAGLLTGQLLGWETSARRSRWRRLLAAFLPWKRAVTRAESFRLPVTVGAMVSSVVAVAATIGTWQGNFAAAAAVAASVAAVWCLISIVVLAPAIWTTARLAATVALTLVLAASWPIGGEIRFSEIAHVESQLLLLAVWVAVGIAVRMGLGILGVGGGQAVRQDAELLWPAFAPAPVPEQGPETAGARQIGPVGPVGLPGGSGARTAPGLAFLSWPRWGYLAWSHGSVLCDQFGVLAMVLALNSLAAYAVWPDILAEFGQQSPESVAEISRLGTGWRVWGTWGASLLSAASCFLASLWLAGRTRASTVSRWGMEPHFGVRAGLFRDAMFLLVLVACTLIARGFAESLATATALRWTCALAGVGLTATICARQWLAARLPLAFLSPADAAQQDAAPLRPLRERLAMPLAVLLVTGVPVIGLTAWACQFLSWSTLAGPRETSWFSGLSAELSYGMPLALLVVIFFAFAVREGLPPLALGGALCGQYAASIVCMFTILAGPVGEVAYSDIRMVQANAVAAGGFTLLWALLFRWLEPARGLRERPAAGEAMAGVLWWLPTAAASRSFSIQAAIPGVLLGVLGIRAAAASIWHVESPQGALAWLGQWQDYVALAFVMAGVALAALRGGVQRLRAVLPQILMPGLLLLTPLLAATLSGQAAGRSPAGYQLLMVGWTCAAALAVAGSWLSSRGPLAGGPALSEPPADEPAAAPDHLGIRNWIAWSVLAGMPVVWLSARQPALEDFPRWGAASLTALVGVVVLAAIRAHWSVLGNAAMVLAGWAAIAWSWTWSSIANGYWPGTGTHAPRASYLALIAMCLLGLFWLARDVARQRGRWRSLGDPFQLAAPHHWFALPLLLGTGWVTLSVMWAAVGERATIPGTLFTEFARGPWVPVSLTALGLLMVGGLWDRFSRYSLPLLFTSGFVVVAAVIAASPVDVAGTRVSGLLGTAILVALGGVCWWQGARLAAWGQRWGIEEPVRGLERTERWLPWATLGLSVLVGVAATALCLDEPRRTYRLLAGMTPALLAAGIAGLAQRERRAAFQQLALWGVTWAGVLVSWADTSPDYTQSGWLTHLIQLVISLGGLAFVYAVGVTRWVRPPGSWNLAVRRVAVQAAGGALAALAASLLIEGSMFLDDPQRGAPISAAQLTAVSLVLCGLVAAMIALALSPGLDPLGLSERGRCFYVYTAQLLLALLFAHILFVRPDWFSERFWQYWPYVLIAVAFAGALVGELFQRAGLSVLGEPFQRTGGFLPLIPVIGWWTISSQTNYSLLLMLTGLVYVWLSLTRKSLFSKVAATVAGNGALWALWSDRELPLVEYPQLWLIPPAVCALVAAELNRRRLPSATRESIRYAASLAIYLSSASEIFLRGIGEAIWPPMVLLGLSLFGALLGLALRIRPFLFLGTAFTLLAIVSMVWHAARAIGHVWPWWAFGIGLGLAILTLFGYFEKNREQLQAWSNQLRNW